MTPDDALSIRLVERPDLPSVILQALYRITGRSTVELRRAIAQGEPVYTASLFGADHIEVVPRLEKTASFLTEHRLAFVIEDWVDGIREEISPETMRRMLDAPG